MKLIKKGSVKDIYTHEGRLLFNFSDRYSIYDWGEMPNLIPSKGESLLNFAYNTFNYLQSPGNWERWEIPVETIKSNYYCCKTLREFRERGINSHLIGQTVIENKEFLEIEEMNIPKISYKNQSWDYSEYANNKLINTLIPLEVIFRFSIPQGSSILKRISDKNYLELLGLSCAPHVGDSFDCPIVEFSTKLEEKDRYISYEEAKNISGMSCVEFENLRSKVLIIALRLKDYFSDRGLELCDGKFEFAYGDFDEEGKRDLKLIDSIGPDELRLKKDGVQLSKEVLRKCYQDSVWAEKLEVAKNEAKEQNRIDWKDICINELGSSPEPLKSSQIDTVSQMYKGLNLALLKDTNLLDECIPRIKEL